MDTVFKECDPLLGRRVSRASGLSNTRMENLELRGPIGAWKGLLQSFVCEGTRRDCWRALSVRGPGGTVGEHCLLGDPERRKRANACFSHHAPTPLVSYLTYSSTLKMEAICSSETSGCLRTTQRYNPPKSVLFRNLNSHIVCKAVCLLILWRHLWNPFVTAKSIQTAFR
jgi:hypothetical protein